MPAEKKTARRARVGTSLLLGGLRLAGCAGASSSSATVVEASGDVGTHDPALAITDEAWYVYSTGGGMVGGGSPQIRRSVDEGATWEFVGTAWDRSTAPEWIRQAVPGYSNIWAPEVVEHDGTYYLYYSASTFGKNTSAIGLATSPTLDVDDPAYGWQDQGLVWASAPTDGYNAIDPGVVTDADGTPWMAFGSFWGGIQLIELEWPSGLPVAGAEPVTIASRGDALNAIEAPYLAQHEGWYYLFVSRDSCCQGLDSTYSIAVGRSREVTGPYLGPDGTPMTENGGLELLATSGDMIGPGGQSVADGHLAFHFYDGADAGAFKLGIRELGWDRDGWPVAWTSEELLGARRLKRPRPRGPVSAPRLT